MNVHNNKRADSVCGFYVVRVLVLNDPPAAPAAPMLLLYMANSSRAGSPPKASASASHEGQATRFLYSSTPLQIQTIPALSFKLN